MKNLNEKPTILIVEDTPEFIHVLIECLSDDYAIRVATNGLQALHIAASEPYPDLILLDVLMPGMDGYEVCTRLKQDPKTAGIAIIFTTALGDEHDEQKGLELGAQDYIAKPYRLPLVKARVHNQLQLKHYRDSLENLVQERTRELFLTQDAAIYGLGILAEYRDNETGMHIRRTQSYVELLARHLAKSEPYKSSFDEATIHLLVQSAPLHDIGKVAIPDSILRKPGALTEDEYAQIRKHTEYGKAVIDSIEAVMKDDRASFFLRYAKEVAFSHHERWDGSGYHGLKGDEIPISGRLMALADIYDALTSRRVYKTAITHEDTVRIITEGDGRTMPSHFDPDVLKAFVVLNKQFQAISLRWHD